MVHMPTVSVVSQWSLIRHTAGVSEAKVTGNPDVDPARSSIGARSRARALLGEKSMVCTPAVTANMRSTSVAARYEAFPACEARSVQLPTAIKVTVVTLTAQIDGVSEATLPADRPDDAVALAINGGAPNGWLPIAVKLIVWLACAVTVKL